MLSNVASTQFSCDRLVPSLFTVPNFTKTLWLTVELVITTEQSAVTLNNVHCTSDVCISLFQDFQQFHSWYFQRRKKFRPRQLGPRMPGGGALVHWTTWTTYCYGTAHCTVIKVLMLAECSEINRSQEKHHLRISWRYIPEKSQQLTYDNGYNESTMSVCHSHQRISK